MNIYLLEQNVNGGYDIYDSCVVCAKNEDDAKTIHPSDTSLTPEKWKDCSWNMWAYSVNDVKCTKIGAAEKEQKRGVILASFNAG